MSVDPGLVAVPAPADPGRTRSVIAHAVSVVSTGLPGSDGELHLMTVDSFTVVSDCPLLACVALRESSRMLSAIRTNDAFAVSVLGRRQSGLASWFASRERPYGSAQLAEVAWRPAEQVGAPLLGGAAAWFECRAPCFTVVGDHVVVVAQVVAARPGPSAEQPLIRHQRSFRGLGRRTSPTPIAFRA